MIIVTSTPASASSVTVRIPCLQGRDSVANTLNSLPWRWASLMTPSAALLLQWVMTESPSLILLAPMRAMVSTAFSDLSQNARALRIRISLAWSTDAASSTPIMVEWTPFQRDTAVGRESRMVRVAALRSSLKASTSLPWYVSANLPMASAPARAILPAPRMVMSRILSDVSAMMSCTGTASRLTVISRFPVISI